MQKAITSLEAMRDSLVAAGRRIIPQLHLPPDQLRFERREVGIGPLRLFKALAIGLETALAFDFLFFKVFRETVLGPLCEHLQFDLQFHGRVVGHGVDQG